MLFFAASSMHTNSIMWPFTDKYKMSETVYEKPISDNISFFSQMAPGRFQQHLPLDDSLSKHSGDNTESFQTKTILQKYINA